MNDETYTVATFGNRTCIDDAWFELNENKVLDKGRHVYTLLPDMRMEQGADYQAWEDDIQKAVEFSVWAKRSRQYVKNLIIDGKTYQVKGSAYLWPHPKLYYNKKHVGFIIEDNELVWIGKNGQLYYPC